MKIWCVYGEGGQMCGGELFHYHHTLKVFRSEPAARRFLAECLNDSSLCREYEDFDIEETELSDE